MSASLLNAIALSQLSGIGPRLLERLAKLAIHNVQDLLLHLPLRYEDRRAQTRISQLQVGQTATIQGQIVQCQIQQQRRRSLSCLVNDSSGTLLLRFFHFNAGLKNSLTAGTAIQAYGEIRRGQHYPEMIHPEYQLANQRPSADTLGIMPIYPTTEGISQAVWRKIIAQALTLLVRCPVNELLPNELNPYALSFVQALQFIHQPPAEISLAQLNQFSHPAQQRLIIEEMVAHHLTMLRIRQQHQQYQAPRLLPAPEPIAQFLAQLPFTPTDAQQRVSQQIADDLQKTSPMMRLVQGDVGSGKTLVAAIAALTAVANQQQVALMAPTELLAEQHAATFSHWFSPLAIKVGYLAGKQKKTERQQQQQAIAAGEIAIVIGTHAIFQENITFAQLGLVIIDEQHRFGVEQRLTLWQKGQQHNHYPHQLIMTATPIPRTLAMTAYADLDVSVIDQLPPGRTPITTIAIADYRRDEVVARVAQACQDEQRQVYWVCTLIEESELLAAQDAQATWQALQQALPQLSIGLVHGRMKSAEKQAVMAAFKQGDLQLLVTTTVIEVGVDVPNASLMIIENPERLGLAQLHQLRGRVGRGAIDSYCVLLYKNPLSYTARQRLQVLRESHDGFVIAQRDLEIRGPGELLGTKQTGALRFHIVDLLRDNPQIAQAQQIASRLRQDYPQQADALIERWFYQQEKYRHA